MRIPRKRILARRNPIASDLRTPKYRCRVVRPAKGRGSYARHADKQGAHDRDI
jgi:stalled ribosome alternative rescue factor ArfA